VNTVQQLLISDDDRNNARIEWQSDPLEITPTLSPELNRMLSAAVVSVSFRRLLLRDPIAAVTRGYNGESFEIPADELTQIKSIRAESLAQFASQLIDRLWFGRPEESRTLSFSRIEPVRCTAMKPAHFSEFKQFRI
jgi:hypothetical protein